MFNEVKQNLSEEVQKFATKNIIKKLQEQGINYQELEDEAFNDLVADEVEILKADSKKVGTGVGIGILISLITGI